MSQTTASKRDLDRIQGDSLENYIFTGGSPSASPFPLGAEGLWDDVEDGGKFGSKRKHDELNDELLTMLKDAGLESMALEVGTLQGGQIAALHGGGSREGSIGKPTRPFSAEGSPVEMTASAIFSPNPRGSSPAFDSPMLLKRALGSSSPPTSMTASAIFSPDPGRGALAHHMHESPTSAMRGTDLRQAASAAEPDSPAETKPYVKKTRKSLPPSRDIPPPEPVPPPPPGPTGRTRRACTTQGTEASPDMDVPTRRTKKQDKPSKGLRHFSVKVCRKVEEKGSTSYNEVADELVRELAMERDYGTGKETQYDDKNIRRRVYDALNVLMAIDIISKDRKEIKWKGLPDSVAQSSIGALQRKKHDRERSLDRKKEQLAELLVQHIAFRNLARRNRANAAKAVARRASDLGGEGAGCPGEQDEETSNSKIYMPFIVVSSSNDTLIQCEMAENREDVFFNFSHQFEIADDNEILKRLGLHKCRKEDLPILVARELIPRVPDDVLIDDERTGSCGSAPSSPSSSGSEYSPS